MVVGDETLLKREMKAEGEGSLLLKGLIFDSAPALTGPWERAKAYTEALHPRKGKAAKLAIFWLVYGYLRLQALWRLVRAADR